MGGVSGAGRGGWGGGDDRTLIELEELYFNVSLVI